MPADPLDTLLAAIEKLHRPHHDAGLCVDCGRDWPCPTIRAVHAYRAATGDDR